MRVVPTDLADVLLLQPTLFTDERGSFCETWNARTFAEATGLDVEFVQDNHSVSAPWVLRGLHYQIHHAQGKLVRVSRGAIVDVAVDLRRSSPTFGRATVQHLDADNALQMWIPQGFAHGFMALDAGADVLYKATDFYRPEHERTIRYDDPELGIAWPMAGACVVSPKDAAGTPFADAECFE